MKLNIFKELLILKTKNIKSNKKFKKRFPSNVTGENFCQGKVTKCFPGDK